MARGWHLNDLADVCSYSFLLASDYYRSNDAGTPFAGDQKVRQAIKDSLASSRLVRRLSSAREQQAADATEFNVIF